MQQVTEQPEQFKALLALEERFAALINVPEDASEVEQLVEDYARELGPLQPTFSAYQSPGNGPIDNALANVAGGFSISSAAKVF